MMMLARSETPRTHQHLGNPDLFSIMPTSRDRSAPTLRPPHVKLPKLFLHSGKRFSTRTPPRFAGGRACRCKNSVRAMNSNRQAPTVVTSKRTHALGADSSSCGLLGRELFLCVIVPGLRLRTVQSPPTVAARRAELAPATGSHLSPFRFCIVHIPSHRRFLP